MLFIGLMFIGGVRRSRSASAGNTFAASMEK
jgi:hypothetical protein